MATDIQVTPHRSGSRPTRPSRRGRPGNGLVVAEDGLSVVLSSHVIADLERVADYLIVLSRGQVQVAGEVEGLLAEHRTLTGPAAAADDVAERLAVVYARRAGTLGARPSCGRDGS